MTDINQRPVPVRLGDSLVSITMLGHPGIGGDKEYRALHTIKEIFRSFIRTTR